MVCKSWVDDINLRAEGCGERIVESLADATVFFARRVEENGLALSGKSAVVASTKALAKRSHNELADMGIALQETGVAADLAIERGPRRAAHLVRHRGRLRNATSQGGWRAVPRGGARRRGSR